MLPGRPRTPAGLRLAFDSVTDYVHGYSDVERDRLADQADVLTDLLHGDTHYPAGARVLEAGCGVGAQTSILARRSPRALITSTDISATSLAEAQRRIRAEGHHNVRFEQQDINRLTFDDASFDHVFVCFVLEHLSDPEAALRSLLRVLRPTGTITVIEGDHGSAFFHPDGERARRVVQCLVDLQAAAGGDALIGRRLRPLLVRAGAREPRVIARQVYVDGDRKPLIEGFTRKTFIAMVEAVGNRAVEAGLISQPAWDAGVRELERTATDDGTFCYTFFKAVGTRDPMSSSGRSVQATTPGSPGGPDLPATR